MKAHCFPQILLLITLRMHCIYCCSNARLVVLSYLFSCKLISNKAYPLILITLFSMFESSLPYLGSCCNIKSRVIKDTNSTPEYFLDLNIGKSTFSRYSLVILFSPSVIMCCYCRKMLPVEMYSQNIVINVIQLQQRILGSRTSNSHQQTAFT